MALTVSENGGHVSWAGVGVVDSGLVNEEALNKGGVAGERVSREFASLQAIKNAAITAGGGRSSIVGESM